MKKVFAIAFIGALVLTSCSKKEVATESNVMLPEPEVVVSETPKPDSAVAQVSTPVATPVAKDSATTK